jgi:hypothetical protein
MLSGSGLGWTLTRMLTLNLIMKNGILGVPVTRGGWELGWVGSYWCDIRRSLNDSTAALSMSMNKWQRVEITYQLSHRAL